VAAQTTVESTSTSVAVGAAGAGDQGAGSSTSSVVPPTTPAVITQDVITQVLSETAGDSKGLVVDQATTEITCDKACVSAFLLEANVEQGDVYVSVNGGARIKVSDLQNSKIMIDSATAKLDFTVVAPDGQETLINLPITRVENAAQDSSNSNWYSGIYWLWWLILILVVLAIWIYLRKKSKKLDS
jgi:hypothetical protein